ncbi:hypothetical protein BG004_005413, partial [Podila humilis]
MKIFAVLPALALLASSAQAYCMNAHSEDAIHLSALVDSCGTPVASGDVFVLYDKVTGVYVGNGEKNWLTLTKTAPAGFFLADVAQKRNHSDDGQCKAKTGCYQVGFLSSDQPVNVALSHFTDENGYVHVTESNCDDKKYKWVVKKTKTSAGWKATYNFNDLVT